MPKRKPSYVPPKIEDMGLKKYLNLTKREHRDLGYEDFVTRIEYGVSKVRMAFDFNVSPITISRWIDIHEKEINDNCKK